MREVLYLSIIKIPFFFVLEINVLASSECIYVKMQGEFELLDMEECEIIISWLVFQRKGGGGKIFQK